MELNLVSPTRCNQNDWDSYPMMHGRSHPIIMEVPPVLEDALSKAAVSFPEFKPLATFDSAHGGEYSGVVVCYEDHPPVVSDGDWAKVNGLQNRLRARISFEGIRDNENASWSYNNLGRLHLSLYSQRLFLEEVGEQQRIIREGLNASLRWVLDPKTEAFIFDRRGLDISRRVSVPDPFDSRDSIKPFYFHPMRSTYIYSTNLGAPKEDGSPENLPTLRRVFPLSTSVERVSSQNPQLRELLQSTYAGFNILPLVGFKDFKHSFETFFGSLNRYDDLPKFPRTLLNPHDTEEFSVEEGTQFLFGELLPMIKKDFYGPCLQNR